MKKYCFMFLVVLAVLLFAACHESLEDRAERECKEFTEKNCPQQLQNGMVYDSLTFERDSRTIHYWYTITGKGDDANIIRKQRPQLRSSLLEGIRDDVESRVYKDAGFGFAITCHSQKAPTEVLLDEHFTAKDYK